MVDFQIPLLGPKIKSTYQTHLAWALPCAEVWDNTLYVRDLVREGRGATKTQPRLHQWPARDCTNLGLEWPRSSQRVGPTRDNQDPTKAQTSGQPGVAASLAKVQPRVGPTKTSQDHPSKCQAACKWISSSWLHSLFAALSWYILKQGRYGFQL